MAFGVVPAHEVEPRKLVLRSAAELAAFAGAVAPEPVLGALGRRRVAPLSQSALHRRPRDAEAQVDPLVSVLVADGVFDGISAVEWHAGAAPRGLRCVSCGWPSQRGSWALQRDGCVTAIVLLLPVAAHALRDNHSLGPPLA